MKTIHWCDYIISDPAVCHGKACTTGTRVMATVVLAKLAEGLSAREITKRYPPVSEGAVKAAALYAAELAKQRNFPLGVQG